jgi:hypothetical protein
MPRICADRQQTIATAILVAVVLRVLAVVIAHRR